MAFRSIPDFQVSLGNLQDEMNRLFSRVWHGGVSTGPFDGQEWGPAIDLYEHDDRYTLFVEVPGIDGKSIDVSYVGTALTVRGEKVKPAGIAEDNRAIHRERRFGTFCRTIELPGDIVPEQLSAKCQAGVLEVTIPKSEASKPKAVKIEVEDGAPP